MHRRCGSTITQQDRCCSNVCFTGRRGIIQIQPGARKKVRIAQSARTAVRQSTTSQLVELLVANLDSLALVALVLEEAKDSNSENAEHKDVACHSVSAWSLCNIADATRRTKHESNDAASEVDQAAEEVDEQVDNLRGELECKGSGLLDKFAGGREERPDELQEGREDVGERLDDGRHCNYWWMVGWYVDRFNCKFEGDVKGVSRVPRTNMNVAW